MFHAQRIGATGFEPTAHRIGFAGDLQDTCVGTAEFAIVGEGSESLRAWALHGIEMGFG